MPTDTIEVKKGRLFLLWFAQNVLIPLMPILIMAFVDLLIKVPAHWASSETVLVYTFLLPVVYLEKASSPFGNMFFWVTSVFGVILYTVAHMLLHLEPKFETNIIYDVAIALDVIYIVVASVYELVRTYRGDRVVQ